MDDGVTIGVELEWPDVDRQAVLPDGWAWSTTDYTIVNRSGFANDPLGKLPVPGGELNSPPYATLDALVVDVGWMWARMAPGYNYRSNLHIHVRVPGLEDDLVGLKRIAQVTRWFLPPVLRAFDPLEALLAGVPEDELPEARARLVHSRHSRQHFITAERHARRMATTTPADFLAAEVPRSHAGVPQWQLGSREAVNLRALRKHGTVEFRCFAAPRVPSEVMAAAGFAVEWLRLAVRGETPLTPALRWADGLPRQAPFDARLERGWRRTNLKAHSRAEVARLLQEGLECTW